jgi:hypothetical protein
MPDWYSRTTEARTPLLCSFTNCVSGYGTVDVLLCGAARRKRTHEFVSFSAGGRSRPDTDHLKQRQVETDAERQDQRRRDRKRRRLDERAHADGRVLHRIVEPVPSPRIAGIFEQAVVSPNFEGSCIDSRCSFISRTSSRSRRDRLSNARCGEPSWLMLIPIRGRSAFRGSDRMDARAVVAMPRSRPPL